MFDKDLTRHKNNFSDSIRRTVTMADERIQASTAITPAIVLLVALASSLTPLAQFENVYAMGDNPSTCKNLYDSNILFMQVKEGNNYYYPQWERVQFNSNIGQGYDVTMIIHAGNINKDGNRNIGSIWYSDNSLGYGNGHCVNNIRHDSYIMITIHHIVMGQAHQGLKQNVYLYTWANNRVQQGPTYNITWS